MGWTAATGPAPDPRRPDQEILPRSLTPRTRGPLRGVNGPAVHGEPARPCPMGRYELGAGAPLRMDEPVRTEVGLQVLSPNYSP